MILVVCVDERDGMLFAGRRQSRDRAVTARILSLAGSARIFVTPYTAKLFSEGEDVLVSDHPEKDAGAGDFYFAEDGALPEEGVEKIFLFHWNRRYPADRFFDRARFSLSPAGTEEFAGYSHETVTLETCEVNA